MNGQLLYAITLVFFLILIIFLQKKFHLLEDTTLTTISVKPYSLARTQLVWWTFIVISSIVAIIWATGKIPDLSDSTLILLGIGSLTTVAARLTDISDDSKAVAANTAAGIPPAAANAATATTAIPTARISRNSERENFLLDILSDKNGISIHRLQAVVFNLVFGLWFIYEVFQHIKCVNSCSLLSPADVTEATKRITALLQLPKSPCTDELIKKLQEGVSQSALVNYIIPDISHNNLILIGMSSGTYAALKTTENSNLPSVASSTQQMPPQNPQGGMVPPPVNPVQPAQPAAPAVQNIVVQNEVVTPPAPSTDNP